MYGSNTLMTQYVGLDLAVFTVTGADALPFLQSQLTQDVEHLIADNAHPIPTSVLAGFCTAKGKLLANMVLSPTATENQFLGMAKADVLPAFLKRLRMFVLRSKVILEPVSLSVSGIVIAADDLQQAETALGHPLPHAVWATVVAENGVWVSAPSADNNILRFWWIADTNQSETLTNCLGQNLTVVDSADDWSVMDLQAGLPWIEADTQDLLIPQTVNLDLIQGVSFTKGCYPGQEVVARAHYRGTVKRRMQLGHINTDRSANVAIKPGEDIFCPADGPSPCGRVISIARDATHTWLLFEAPLKITQAEPAATLHVGAVDGPILEQQALPYSVVAS